MNEENNDKLELSLEDLEEEDSTGKDRLVITPDDLLDVPDTPVSPQPPSIPTYSQVPSADLPVTRPKTGTFAMSNLLQNFVAGAVGGLLAWAVTEPFFNEGVGTYTSSLLIHTGIFGGLMGAVIGLALGGIEGIMSRVVEKFLIGAALGLGIGFVGGFVGGVIAQSIYSALGGGGAGITPQQILARAIGWGVIGLFVGLGQGVAIRSTRKIVNSLVGGLVGGIIGGLLFDPIGMVIGGGAPSRAFAITALGACAGAAIGLVEELRKQAWLSVVQGWLKGKQFIIYKDETTIGSSPKCDIPILKDTSVAANHAVVRAERGRYTIHAHAPMHVNQRPVSHKVLQNGDMIGIGSTVFLYSEKVSEGAIY